MGKIQFRHGVGQQTCAAAKQIKLVSRGSTVYCIVYMLQTHIYSQLHSASVVENREVCPLLLYRLRPRLVSWLLLP